MRIRTIRPEFYNSETIGSLSWDARLVFICLWSYVEDNGVNRANLRLFRGTCMPYDGEDSLHRIESAVEELENAGCVERYTRNGHDLLWIPNFLRYQKIDRESKPHFKTPLDPIEDSTDTREYSTNTLEPSKHISQGSSSTRNTKIRAKNSAKTKTTTTAENTAAGQSENPGIKPFSDNDDKDSTDTREYSTNTRPRSGSSSRSSSRSSSSKREGEREKTTDPDWTANDSIGATRPHPQSKPQPVPGSSSQCSNQPTPDQPSPAGDVNAESSSETLASEEEPVTVVVEEESPTTPNPAAPFADEDADGAVAGVGELAAAELVDDHTPPCKDPKFGGMTVRQALAAWQPNEEHRRLASELGVDCDVEATVMRSWGRSHPEKVDWQDYDANFTLWMSRTHKWDAPGSKRGRTGKSKTQANLEENAGVVMEIARESAEKRKTQNNKPRRSYR